MSHTDPDYLAELEKETEFLNAKGRRGNDRIALKDPGESMLLRIVPYAFDDRGKWFARIARHWIANKPYICTRDTDVAHGGDPDGKCEMCDVIDKLNRDRNKTVSQLAWKMTAVPQYLLMAVPIEHVTSNGQTTIYRGNDLKKAKELWLYKEAFQDVMTIFKTFLRRTDSKLSIVDPVSGCDLWMSKSRRGLRFDRADPLPLAPKSANPDDFIAEVLKSISWKPDSPVTGDEMEDLLLKIEDICFDRRSSSSRDEDRRSGSGSRGRDDDRRGGYDEDRRGGGSRRDDRDEPRGRDDDRRGGREDERRGGRSESAPRDDDRRTDERSRTDSPRADSRPREDDRRGPARGDDRPRPDDRPRDDRRGGRDEREDDRRGTSTGGGDDRRPASTRGDDRPRPDDRPRDDRRGGREDDRHPDLEAARGGRSSRDLDEEDHRPRGAREEEESPGRRDDDEPPSMSRTVTGSRQIVPPPAAVTGSPRPTGREEKDDDEDGLPEDDKDKAPAVAATEGEIAAAPKADAPKSEPAARGSSLTSSIRDRVKKHDQGTK